MSPALQNLEARDGDEVAGGRVSSNDPLLVVATETATPFARRTAMAACAGRDLASMDGLIVATALAHDLILVTRNGKDFAGFGLEIMDPWNS